MIFRCIAHDMPCAVVQFIKGGMSTGERDLILSKFPDACAFHTMGEGFTWETQDKARDVEMAQAAWEKAKELIRDPANRMVLLDEINIALRYDYIDVAEVVAFLKAEKPEMTHVVLTGRNAKEELIEAADLVTEMELVKHPVPVRDQGAERGWSISGRLNDGIVREEHTIVERVLEIRHLLVALGKEDEGIRPAQPAVDGTLPEGDTAAVARSRRADCRKGC